MGRCTGVRNGNDTLKPKEQGRTPTRAGVLSEKGDGSKEGKRMGRSESHKCAGQSRETRKKGKKRGVGKAAGTKEDDEGDERMSQWQNGMTRIPGGSPTERD